MSDPIQPAPPADKAADKTPDAPARTERDIPASPTDDWLGPAADPAEGKRE